MANFFDQFDTQTTENDRVAQTGSQAPGAKTQSQSMPRPDAQNFFDQFDEPKEPQDPKMGLKEVAMGAISNVPKSAAQFVEDIVSPFLSPVETAKAIGSLGAGLAQKLVPGKQEHEETVDALADFFVERYGGIENIKKTIATDPVGIAGDIASIFTGGGAALKGASIAGKTTKLAKAADIASKIGKAVDPLSAAGKGLRAGIKKSIPKDLPAKKYESAVKFTISKKDPTVTAKKIQEIAQFGLDKELMPTTRGVEKLRGDLKELNNEIAAKIDEVAEKGAKVPLAAMFKEIKPFKSEQVSVASERAINRQIKNIAIQLKKGQMSIAAYDKLMKKAKLAKQGKATLSQAELKKLEAMKNKQLSPQKVQALKRKLYQETESLYHKTSQKPVVGETKQKIASAARKSLNLLIPELENLNKTDALYLQLRNELNRAARRISNRDLINIGTAIKSGTLGTAGGVVGGGAGAAAGTALGLSLAILDTPKVKAKLSIVANRLKKKGVIIDPNSLLSKLTKKIPSTALSSRLAAQIEKQKKDGKYGTK